MLLLPFSNPFFLSRNPSFLILYAMSSSTKIIAEYAKSGKSACKKCSEKIDSKSLRLGVKVRDPRGYDSVKWHHFGCFLALDSVSVAAADIEGFSELTGSDQEKLKQLESEGDKASSEKREGDEVSESDKRDLKKLKTNEKEETGHEKKNATNEKIVAEYAKSGRSSCKKCSEKIESKSLRLGLSSWDPRGFANTKWHHLDCFFPLDVDLVSPESIEGFTDLKSSDQEKLKKLVAEQDQSSKKSNEDGETELQGLDQKSEKVSDSLDEAIGSEIAFAVGDVKDNYKGATLQPKWKALQTIIYLERDEGLHDSKKIAAFDFDGCLAKTSVQ
ncbi:polynucleotide 3'-phosphatase ZDP-like, partial [Bidens hawaiensis]|uniref:polynucleotide 3'-phosphatase ZDP-like n=1 Tax=Bidens hawaiensis TaxID=980011 RepID=UPI0040491B43